MLSLPMLSQVKTIYKYVSTFRTGLKSETRHVKALFEQTIKQVLVYSAQWLGLTNHQAINFASFQVRDYQKKT